MTYIVTLRGDDTLSFSHTTHVLEVKAENIGLAHNEAQKWCDEHSYMGGYEWFIKEIKEK